MEMNIKNIQDKQSLLKILREQKAMKKMMDENITM